MPPRKRNPLRLDRYMKIHEGHMQHLKRSGYVLKDGLRSLRQTKSEFIWSGNIYCPGQVSIWVNKKLSILSWEGNIPVVKTSKYEYNASIKGIHNLFRYDNTHRGNRYPGHVDDFHKHIFDLRTGKQIPKSPIWIGECVWPTLDEVIREACTLYAANSELIDSLAQCKDSTSI